MVSILFALLLTFQPALGVPSYLPIGVITGGKGHLRATGFLVNDCDVLTAKHAAGRVAEVLGRRMKFRVLVGGRRLASGGTVFAAGNMDNLMWASVDRSGDWMLIRLDRCLGLEVGFLALNALPIEQSASWQPTSAGFRLGSFPVDGQPWWIGVRITPPCHLAWIESGRFMTDCIGGPGSSGSPLMAKDQHTGKLFVFGIHSTESATAGGKGKGQAIEVPINKAIRQLVNRDVNLALSSP